MYPITKPEALRVQQCINIRWEVHGKPILDQCFSNRDKISWTLYQRWDKPHLTWYSEMGQKSFIFKLRKSSEWFSLEIHTGGPRICPEVNEGVRNPALTTAGLFVTLVRAVQEAITAFREQDAVLTVLTLELPAHTGQSAMCGWNTGKGPGCTKGLSCLGKGVCILWTNQLLLYNMPLEWWEVTPCRHCDTLHWNLPSWQARVMKESNKLEFKSWLYESLSKLLNGTHIQLLFVKLGWQFHHYCVYKDPVRSSTWNSVWLIAGINKL